MLTRHAEFDSVSPQLSLDTLPVAFAERSSQSTLVLKALLLGPVSLLGAAPLVMIGIDTIAAPASASAATVSPIVAAQLLAALIVWTALFIIPLGKVCARLGRSRTVLIDRDIVQLTTRGLLSRRHDIIRLGSYRGLTHRVRTTLSGARHEIVLVHPRPEYSVLLAVGDRISDARVAQVAFTFGLPEISAKDMHVRRSRRPAFQMQQPIAAQATA